MTIANDWKDIANDDFMFARYAKRTLILTIGGVKEP